MFGFNYLRVGPNFFVVQYVNGKIRRQGRGLDILSREGLAGLRDVVDLVRARVEVPVP